MIAEPGNDAIMLSELMRRANGRHTASPRLCENLPRRYLTSASVGGNKLLYRFPILGIVDNVIMRGTGNLQVDDACLLKAFA